MSTLILVPHVGEKLRKRAPRGLWLDAVCSLLLITSPALAQGGSERAVDFDELIRREELKGGPVSAPPVVQSSPTAAEDLARMVQVELRRVGCDPGAPDGVWGPVSRRAAASFNRYGNAQYSTDTPSGDLLRDLRGRSARVCPVEVPPPHIATAPAETTPEPSPRAAEEISLAGTWSGQSDCPLDLGFQFTLTPTGHEQYRISGPFGMTGWVSGNRVHMEAQIFINHVVYDGTVASPVTMGGKVAPSLMLGATCNWQAHRS